MIDLVAWNIDGFEPFEWFRTNRELWALMMRAQSEILNLPRFGWTGWLLSFVLGNWATEKMNLTLLDSAKPVVYHEFNAYHHGAKVAKQDVRVLEDILSEGEKVGRKMNALREIVSWANKIHS
jgi:hypothetical protein